MEKMKRGSRRMREREMEDKLSKQMVFVQGYKVQNFKKQNV